jgi:hypothetical protein
MDKLTATEKNLSLSSLWTGISGLRKKHANHPTTTFGVVRVGKENLTLKVDLGRIL